MIEKLVKAAIVILLVSFLVMFFTSSSGYYEYELNKKTSLTNEAIAKFENDVKSGKKIDINDYLKDNNKNYDNKVSRLGNTISDSIEGVMETSIKYLFKYLEKSINLDE